jgi:hypothetical protein
MVFHTDPVAREIALKRWTLPECLHVPVAAVDEQAIRTYIGDIERVLSSGVPPKAFLVAAKEAPVLDPRLPICELPACSVLHQRQQVWVHISFTRYSAAWRRAFPDRPVGKKVLAHMMNRVIAAHKGYNYVRITPTSRGCNSSSSTSEGWGKNLYSEPEPHLTLAEVQLKRRQGAFVQYADLPDLMVMLDIWPGGGVMAAVNEAQNLVTSRKG